MNRLFKSFAQCATLALAALGLSAHHAHAQSSTAVIQPCASAEGIASFYSTMTYTYGGGTTASLAITMTNDTMAGMGGYITAIALNLYSPTAGVSFTSCTDADFSGLVGPIDASPFGTFRVGSSIGGGWLGSGSPTGGIGIGFTETFNFTLTGDAATLAALDAETVLAETGYAMAVRFRGGAVDGWSDKVVGCVMPTPGALALLGLAGVVGVRRRK